MEQMFLAALQWLGQHKEEVAALVALGGLLTFLHNWRMRAYARILTQAAIASSGGTTLYQTILSEYTERKFSGKTPVIAPNARGENEEHVFVKTAKTRAIEIIADDMRNSTSIWDGNSAREESNRGKWENRTAYETALAMQQIGLAAFCGIAPITIVLANVSDVAIDDWIISREWLRTYRAAENYQKFDQWDKAQVVDYHRRHAEWLFTISVLWSRTTEWNHDRRGDYRLPDTTQLTKRLRVLSRADGNLMPQFVANDIHQALGIWVLPLKWYQYAWYFWPLYWRSLPLPWER